MTRVEVETTTMGSKRFSRPRWVDNRLLFRDEDLAHIAWGSACIYAQTKGTTMRRALEELSRPGPKDYLI